MEDNKPQEEELEPKRPKIIKKAGMMVTTAVHGKSHTLIW